MYSTVKQSKMVTKPVGTSDSILACEKQKDKGKVHSTIRNTPRAFLRKKSHFSRLVSILPSLLKRSNGFLSSPHKLMQFAKTEASHCSCWGIQCYDHGRGVMVSFVNASISMGSQHWFNGLLLHLKNNWHMKLMNPCSNSINILNEVITWMILSLCSSARGNCPGEPVTKV